MIASQGQLNTNHMLDFLYYTLNCVKYKCKGNVDKNIAWIAKYMNVKFLVIALFLAHVWH